MKKVDVLFIDDLFKPVKGKPRATEWAVEQMYAVINHRYLNHMPLLVSSELTIDELCDIDEALGTRIYQMCQDFTVVIKGDRKVLNHRLEGLVERLIDIIIITVGQWGQFGGSEYEQRFESLLCQLQEVVGVSRKQAIQMIFDEVKGAEVA